MKKKRKIEERIRARNFEWDHFDCIWDTHWFQNSMNRCRGNNILVALFHRKRCPSGVDSSIVILNIQWNGENLDELLRYFDLFRSRQQIFGMKIFQFFFSQKTQSNYVRLIRFKYYYFSPFAIQSQPTDRAMSGIKRQLIECSQFRKRENRKCVFFLVMWPHTPWLRLQRLRTRYLPI